MKLNDTQKRSLRLLSESLTRAPVVLVQAEVGRHKHVITARLVRAAGNSAVLTTRGAMEKTAAQYTSQRLQVMTPQGTLPPDGEKKPEGQVYVWPAEHLQDQRAMRSGSFGLVVVDVKHEQLARSLRLARSLLAPGGKLVVWHHGEPYPGVVHIPG